MTPPRRPRFPTELQSRFEWARDLLDKFIREDFHEVGDRTCGDELHEEYEEFLANERRFDAGEPI